MGIGRLLIKTASDIYREKQKQKGRVELAAAKEEAKRRRTEAHYDNPTGGVNSTDSRDYHLGQAKKFAAIWSDTHPNSTFTDERDRKMYGKNKSKHYFSILMHHHSLAHGLEHPKPEQMEAIYKSAMASRAAFRVNKRSSKRPPAMAANIPESVLEKIAAIIKEEGTI